MLRGRLARTGVIVAVAVAAAGCTRSWDTSDIDNPTTTAAVRYSRDLDGVVASITDLLSRDAPDQSHWSPSRSEAGCVAERLVRRFGAEGLLDRGFDPNRATLALDYSDEDRVAAINVLVGCVDFAAGFLELVASYEKLPVDDATCMANGVRRLGLDRDLAGSIIDASEPDPMAANQRFGGGLVDLASECIGPESLLTLTDPPKLPAAPADAPRATTTTTSTTSPDRFDDLAGIVPGGPLDPNAAVEGDTAPGDR